jgi:hypothetical protein
MPGIDENLLFALGVQLSFKVQERPTSGLPDNGLPLLGIVAILEDSGPEVAFEEMSDSEPGELYKVLADAGNIPKWAPVFADAIERINDTYYRVTKNGEPFDLEISLHQSAGAIDYIREMSHGKRGGAYIRVNTPSAWRQHRHHDRSGWTKYD